MILSLMSRVNNAIAIDCEMVGVGPDDESVLARISIVDRLGSLMYDTYCQTEYEITDYRTKYSGIRPENLVDGEYCIASCYNVASYAMMIARVHHKLCYDDSPSASQVML